MPVKKNNKKATKKNDLINGKKTDRIKKKIVKKNSKKKHKTAKKKVDKELMDIKKAVRDLPTVLTQEMQQEEEKENIDNIQISVQREKIIPVNRSQVAIYKAPENSQKWLWTAVSLFTVVIFFLWLLNISNVFYDSKGSSNGPLSSLKNSKQDLKNIFNNFDNDIPASTTSSIAVDEKLNNDKEVNKKVQEAMNTLFKSSTSTSSITTSTINN
ncbi:MAG: hypothetical protein A2493_03645 [Candidatus Magasanikbacteria bacterium RIFOXYC12_FULL_33_11]|uniref:Uncharacterized protein n=1 Tax=Candidatus Magasanikbacteria bacterium RIFOXYC12_FULL_33_11 TaxID=1798701 RepID=A0A1F6NRV5_9BACT|nr:MAG: hypothetical protein A2493_03645 [Candidatus Magasanikbacteria bacterium RIFOXYC12_FULL_33_11]